MDFKQKLEQAKRNRMYKFVWPGHDFSGFVTDAELRDILNSLHNDDPDWDPADEYEWCSDGVYVPGKPHSQDVWDMVAERVEHDDLTINDAAEFSGYSQRQLRHAARMGHLPATKHGRAWVIDRVDLVRWMDDPAAHKPGPKVLNTIDICIRYDDEEEMYIIGTTTEEPTTNPYSAEEEQAPTLKSALERAKRIYNQFVEEVQERGERIEGDFRLSDMPPGYEDTFDSTDVEQWTSWPEDESK